jgi:N-glycosylase/DNA lyase
VDSFENRHLNLEFTLECGQTFRWKKMPDGFYYGMAGNNFTRIRQEGPRFYYETAPQPADFKTISGYFRLDCDDEYQEIVRQISNTGPDLYKAVKKYYGLRLLKQPAFETLISFILSANNTIPKVSRTVQAISKRYGNGVVLGRYQGYTFPEPAALAQANEAELEEGLGAEYRAKYIIQSSKRIAEQGFSLENLLELPYDWAVGQLMSLPGVGRTVADCVMLFSLGKYEAFPLDAWVRRTMENLYFEGKKTPDREILLLASRQWGQYAGYANEYLYMFARNQK